MKLLHLSDLHLGRRLYEYSLLEDQEHILNQILKVVDREKPRAVVIAGDVYDKSVPSAEAVSLFDDFLVRLARKDLDIFIISGNHDSAERIAYGGRLMEAKGVHVSPVYAGAVSPITLDGKFDFYLLPFVRPAVVRAVHEGSEIANYTDAVRTAIEAMPVNPGHVRILVAHQFVTGAVRSDSEESYVGDMGNVDVNVFDGFDYVALGHIHATQNLPSPTRNEPKTACRVRYCGTPMQYSLSERNSLKTATIAEVGEDGSVSVREVELTPKRTIQRIEDSFENIMNDATLPKNEFVQVVLTDEEDVLNAHTRLRRIFDHLLCIDYNNTRTRSNQAFGIAERVMQKTPLELFGELFEKRNNRPMSESQRKIVANLMESLKEEDQCGR